MKKKIVIIHPHLSFGGAEKMIAFVANVLSKNNEVHLVLVQDTEIKLLIDSSIQIHKLGINQSQAIKNMGLNGAIKYITDVKKQIRSICNSINNDVVLVFDDRISLIAWLAVRSMPCSIAYSQRADPYNKNLLWKIITSILYRFSNGVVFQTKEAQEFYKLKHKYTKIIPNPAIRRESTKNVLNIKELPDKCIVSAGRFQSRKGFDLLIKAFSIVHKKYPEYQLIIYGDGEEREKLLALIKDNELENKVCLPGNVDNVMDMCRGAEMFVLPSKSEGIPNVLIEALLEGFPCISTDCSPGGARLLLNKGECGLLVPNNDIEALADAMIKYIAQPNLRNEMAQKGVNWIKEFNEERIGTEWISFMNNI